MAAIGSDPLNGWHLRVESSRSEECLMLEDVVVKLKINSSVVRDALLDGCTQVIRFERKHPKNPPEPLSWFSRERCRRRIAAATALDEQLMAGYAVVEVPVEIADAVASNIA